MKKLVGVIPLFDETKDSYWMVPGYFQMLEKEGAVPVMLPLSDDEDTLDYFLERCDGFLFTGGHDVNPSVYKVERSKECGLPCEMRDSMEVYLLNKLKNMDKPVLGICRGIQIINASFGGTLYQDLPTEHKSDVDHHMNPPYDRAVHNVKICKGGSLEQILKKDNIGVNSYHHQAVKELADGLFVEAVSEDGLVEAVSIPAKKFFVGVQWHPEFSYLSDENSVKIVKKFVEAL